MRLYSYPEEENWSAILRRPQLDSKNLEPIVREVLQSVKLHGDEAIKKYTEQFDGVKLKNITVSAQEIEAAKNELSISLKEAIHQAYKNITQFHQQQSIPSTPVETMPGVVCWRKNVGIDKVGLYIPGGTAPLFSTVLMLGVPAQIAGCQEIVLCSPPNQEGNLHPAILFAAKLVGVSKIYKVGGIQAIGAMAYGTEAIPKVYKIFGPGNQYVTKAKQLINLEGTAIDMPAGPSEVLVLGDNTSSPAYIAADLLSQAEHGHDSQVVFVTINKELVAAVNYQIELQLKALPRKEVASKALENSVSIVVEDFDAAVRLINEYAPEHLILATNNAKSLAGKIRNAGSVFLGHYTPESVGDYASGTNHTLPTNGFAKAYSGVSLDSFVKKITFQELTLKGLETLGPVVEEMAEAEDLWAHRNAVSIRLKKEHENN